MNYQEYDTLPAYMPSVDAAGNRVIGNNGLYWSNVAPPPAIGSIIQIRMNSIGLARVVGYFSECGYLGLRAIPFDPPAFYVRQNGYNAPGHVFGAEVTIGEFSEPELDGPDQAQLAALARYAKRHGRAWKFKLGGAWRTGSYSPADETDKALLQQVRNQHGPEWLSSKQNPITP